MVMFGLEGSGFFLSIVFTLLLTGAVVFFMNGRLRSLQSIVVQQAGMLTTLVSEVERRQPWSMGGGASTEALDAARRLSAEADESGPIEIGTIKIEVSDDSCSDAYSSDSECQSESGQCPVPSMPLASADLARDEAAAAAPPSGSISASGMKTITLSDVEDLSTINVDGGGATTDVASVTELALMLTKNSNYLAVMKVGDLRLMADSLLGEGAVTKKTKKADIMDALQKAAAPHRAGTNDLEKV